MTFNSFRSGRFMTVISAFHRSTPGHLAFIAGLVALPFVGALQGQTENLAKCDAFLHTLRIHGQLSSIERIESYSRDCRAWALLEDSELLLSVREYDEIDDADKEFDSAFEWLIDESDSKLPVDGEWDRAVAVMRARDNFIIIRYQKTVFTIISDNWEQLMNAEKILRRFTGLEQ